MSRIAFLVDCPQVESWQYKIIEIARKHYDVDIVTTRKGNSSDFFLRFHQKIDSLLFSNYKDIFSKVEVKPNDIKSNHYDFVVNFSHDFENDLLKLNKQLFFVFGADFFTSSKYKGYEAFINGSEIIEMHLVEVVNNQQRIIASISDTGNPVSYSKNLYKMLMMSPVIFERYLDGKVQYVSTENIELKNLSKINIFDFIINLFKQLSAIFRRIYIKKIKISQWQIWLEKDNKFSLLELDNDFFYADPFIYKHHNHNYIFFEELKFSDNKGYISCYNIEKQEFKRKIVEEDFHLSYPNIFEYEGDIYMVPESSQDRSIRLYKCIEFPQKWEYQYNLMNDIIAFDTTFKYHNQKWWMFTNVDELGIDLDNSELFIFSSDSPISKEWEAHTKNPVVSDVRKSRPAGNIFSNNNTLIRPSQNSTRNYGRNVNLMKINKLSQDEYLEELIEVIEYDNFPGNHTYNFNEDYLVVDRFEIKEKKL